MDARNHSNGANPKSQTSRDKFVNVLKITTKTFLLAITLVCFATACSNEENLFTEYNLSFPENYVPMFYELRTAGCYQSNIEQSLCTYSIAGFRDNLISRHPNLRARITAIIQPYEPDNN